MLNEAFSKEYYTELHLIFFGNALF